MDRYHTTDYIGTNGKVRIIAVINSHVMLYGMVVWYHTIALCTIANVACTMPKGGALPNNKYERDMGGIFTRPSPSFILCTGTTWLRGRSRGKILVGVKDSTGRKESQFVRLFHHGR